MMLSKPKVPRLMTDSIMSVSEPASEEPFTTPATAGQEQAPVASIESRVQLFSSEWIDYIKNRLSENHRYIHLWRGMFATSQLTSRMNRMMNKYFQGVLTVGALNHINISVVHFIYALTALHVAVPGGDATVEVYHKFAEQYFKESFERMECWNWPLTEKNPADLKPVRDDPVDPPYDPAANNGFPGFITFKVGGGPCSCCNSESEDSDYEGSNEDEDAHSVQKHTVASSNGEETDDEASAPDS